MMVSLPSEPLTVAFSTERLKSMEELNEKLINDNVKITKELDLQRTRYLDMKTANVSIVASLKKKDYIINDGQGDKRKQEERATKLANQLEQLELKHDVVLIQLANLRNKHLKLTQSGTTQNVSAVLVVFLLKRCNRTMRCRYSLFVFIFSFLVQCHPCCPRTRWNVWKTKWKCYKKNKRSC